MQVPDYAGVAAGGRQEQQLNDYQRNLGRRETAGGGNNAYIYWIIFIIIRVLWAIAKSN